MNRFYRFGLAIFFVAVGSSAASACSCIKRPEIEQISRNNIVVQGNIVSVKTTTRMGRSVTVARMRVMTVEKGTSRRYINIEAFDYAGQCAVMFKVNEQMRLAAMKRGTLYRTNICRIFPINA